jgi:hypothetical protein
MTTSRTLHEPVPDGRDGPFDRTPHRRVRDLDHPSNPSPLLLDLRCFACATHWGSCPQCQQAWAHQSASGVRLHDAG